MLPEVPEPFYWTTEAWGAALRCRALDPFAEHLFTTRQLPLPEQAAWESLARTIGVGPDRLHRLKQVHGAGVVIARGAVFGELQEADALVSGDPDVALAVQSADCVTMLLADRRTGAVGAVHAGWRGTAARAAGAAVAALQEQFGTEPADLAVAIGPAIGPCCYEVGTELVDAFAEAKHERYLIDRWFLAPKPRRGETVQPKLRLDTVTANRDQLILLGVPGEHVHVAGLCTAMHPDVLPSYRAEKGSAARLAAVIRPRLRP